MSYGEPVDIGHNISVQPAEMCEHGIKYLWVHFYDSDDHPRIPVCPACVGSKAWTVESRDPLTLSPSLEVHGKVHYHGFIHEGKWVPA